MVYLYFYTCSAEDRRAFWQAQLADILQTDFAENNHTVILRPNGKPMLQNGKLFFNVSHSRNTLVIAVSNTEVGVDIEYDRTVSERLRRYCLTDAEQADTPVHNDRAFLRIWTAKESYLKLYGTGLRQPMRSFSVLNDTFSAQDLPPAVFTRIENNDYTLCVATQRQSQLRIVRPYTG